MTDISNYFEIFLLNNYFFLRKKWGFDRKNQVIFTHFTQSLPTSAVGSHPALSLWERERERSEASMAANSGFQLFSSSGDLANFGFGFAGDSPQEALHPPPPSVEVLPSEVRIRFPSKSIEGIPQYRTFLGFSLILMLFSVVQVSENVKFTVEPVNMGGLTLLKVSLPMVFFGCLEWGDFFPFEVNEEHKNGNETTFVSLVDSEWSIWRL